MRGRGLKGLGGGLSGAMSWGNPSPKLLVTSLVSPPPSQSPAVPAPKLSLTSLVPPPPCQSPTVPAPELSTRCPHPRAVTHLPVLPPRPVSHPLFPTLSCHSPPGPTLSQETKGAGGAGARTPPGGETAQAGAAAAGPRAEAQPAPGGEAAGGGAATAAGEDPHGGAEAAARPAQPAVHPAGGRTAKPRGGGECVCTHVCIYVTYVCMFVICIRVHMHNLQSIWLVAELLSRVEVGSAHMRVYVYACDVCVHLCGICV